MDFNSSSSGDLLFPPGSIQGDVKCITIILYSDIFFEVPENFVIELLSSDPAVIIPESADIAIITINDVPDPQGRICVTIANISYAIIIIMLGRV